MESRSDDRNSRQRTSALPLLTQKDTGTKNRQNSPTITVNGHWNFDGGTPSSKEGPATSSVVEVEERNDQRQDSQLRMCDLSFILHPSHEASTPESKAQSTSVPTWTQNKSRELLHLEEACSMLGIAPGVLKQM
jgi:hypothetical protein